MSKSTPVGESQQTDAINRSGNDDSSTDDELTRTLKREYGIDPTDRRCDCGSTDVTHVRRINTPTNFNIRYNCAECAERTVVYGRGVIPVEYARARLTSTNQTEYVSIYDERARMNGAEYA